MSGEEECRRLREEREARHIALRDNIREAQGAMASAGFAISDQATPLDMVTNLLARNAAQKELEDGLRERLKAAESTDTILVSAHGRCPLREGNLCNARALRPRCHDLKWSGPDYPPACRLDEGPILVKKAEEDSGSAPGEAKAIEGVPGDGDPLNDPQSPG